MWEELDILDQQSSKPQLSTALTDLELLSEPGGLTKFDIAVSQNDFFHIPTWLAGHSNDPAIYVCVPACYKCAYS